MGVSKLSFCCLVLSCVIGTRSQLIAIQGNDARISATDVLTATSQIIGNPLPSPELAPLNQRVLRFFWTPVATAHPSTDALVNTLIFDFAAPAPANLRIKLEAPWLEINTDADPNARCNTPTNGAPTGAAYPYLLDADKTLNCQPDNAAAPVPGRMVCLMNGVNAWTSTYFTHPPYPGQNPFMRTYRKICVSTAAAGNTWIDTNVWFAVEHSCNTQLSANGLGDVATSCTNWQAGGNAGPPIAILAPGAAPAASVSLGLFLLPTTGAVPTTIAQPAIMAPDTTNFGETPEMYLDRTNRTQCCGSRRASGTNTAKYGICIHPTRTSCCGFRPYSSKLEKCCSKATSSITWHDRRCSCRINNNDANLEALSCQLDGPNSFATATDGSGITDTLNVANKCCTSTVYSELLTTVAGAGAAQPNAPVATTRSGWCYNTAAEKCCNVDGSVYDAGAQQCCSVNGVQSINEPCPCNLDSQCGTGKRCCLQTFPPAISVNRYPDAKTGNANQCHVYANFPTGSAPASSMNCAGKCYSTAFQICCNGQVCVREYDKCCNATCCNRHTSSCMDGYQPGTFGSGKRINPLNFRVPYEICSEVENLTARRTLFVFVFPTMFLLATLISLAIVTILARRATEHHFDLVEQAIVFVSTAITLLACGFYFSPVYKYGIVISFIGLFSIITAVIRRLAWSVILVFVVVVLLLFLVDPFAGNIYLSFSSGIPPTGGAYLGSDMSKVGPGFYIGAPVPLSHSLFEALARLLAFRYECTSFYDWFQFDVNARDFARMQNPEKMTFGYCTRAWLSTLVIFLIFIVLLSLILFSLSMMSLVKKLAPPRGDDVIQLEVKRGADVYAD